MPKLTGKESHVGGEEIEPIFVWQTLNLNHRLSTYLNYFNPEKSVSAIAAAHLQQWAMFLGAHNYTIEYKGTKLLGNADGLSRLP